MAESLKLRQDEAKALEQLKQKGDQLAQSLRTPMEKFVDAAREAGKLAEAGAISGETYARAMEAAKQELLDSEQSARRIKDLQAAPGTAAAERFTGAGLSAVNSGRREWDRLAKLAEEDARIQKEQKALLAEANRLAGARPVVKTVNL
jgi:ribosomal protein S20